MARSFCDIFVAPFLTLGALLLYQLVCYTTKPSPLQLSFLALSLVAAFHWSRAMVGAGRSIRTRVPYFVEGILVVAAIQKRFAAAGRVGATGPH